MFDMDVDDDKLDKILGRDRGTGQDFLTIQCKKKAVN